MDLQENWYGGDVAVLDEIWVAGNYFNPRGTLSLYWDYGATGQVTLAANKILNATVFFNVTVTIPEAELGIHGITAVDYSYNLNATVNVVPNLILEPSEGPVGTVVKATGYGFPASDTTTDYNVTLTWYGYTTLLGLGTHKQHRQIRFGRPRRPSRLWR
jgi:hypothetical protein